MSELGAMSPGHVYAVAFSNGMLKVGRSQNVRQRLSSVKSMGRRLGGEPTSSLAFTHRHADIGEAVTRRFATDSGGVAVAGHREWLTGVRLDEFLTRICDFWPSVATEDGTEWWTNDKIPGVRGAYIFDRGAIEALRGERAS